jgi:hypothetical protein
MNTHNTLYEKRDKKVRPHLEQYAPIWLAGENTITSDEAIQFNIIFQHKDHGWVNRKYYYDGFNNILYYRGQVTIPEQELPDLSKQEPYITTQTPDPTNSYGG